MERRKMHSFILGFGLITSLTQALPSTSHTEYAVKECHAVPRHWAIDHTSNFSRSDSIDLQFGLRQAKPGAIEQHLLQVSDPNHRRYGQHLSADQVQRLAAPSDLTVNLVQTWLAEHGIHNLAHSPTKEWMTIRVPIEKAERLLKTTYSKFRHSIDGDSLIRAPEWSLPKYLHDHIDVVQPTSSFFRIQAKTSHGGKEGVGVNEWWEKEGKQKYAAMSQIEGVKTVAQVCNNSFVTPECLRTVYGTIDYKPKSNGKSKVGVCNYLDNTAYRKDAAKFIDQFRPDAKGYADKYKITTINGGSDDQGPYSKEKLDIGKNQEGNLDAQTVIGISYPLPFMAYNTGGQPPFSPDKKSPTNTNEPYLEFINYIMSQKDLPQVLSTSYGDDEQTVPESYAKKVCSGFAQLGVQGVSVIFSSGDNGVGSACYSNKPGESNKKTFLPAFPSSCPWVTSVGATENFSPEVATSYFGSGAGFSNYFPQPAYQKSTISGYLKALGDTHKGLYNPTGRAYPDISAQGSSDVIVYNNEIYTIGGTSASAPAVAAILALVNDALIGEGKPVLGFLNPWLYSDAYKTFTDVTQGSSFGCNGKGFPAMKGWDAVTGFGTPDFKKLLEAARVRKGGNNGKGGASTTTNKGRGSSTTRPGAEATRSFENALRMAF